MFKIKARIINVMVNGGKDENFIGSSAITLHCFRGGSSSNYSLAIMGS